MTFTIDFFRVCAIINNMSVFCAFDGGDRNGNGNCRPGGHAED